MKVKTDLKSGNLTEDALQTINDFGNQASNFFSTAMQQAKDVTSKVSDTTNDVWQGLTNLFGFR